MEFKNFGDAVAKQFAAMAKMGTLFTVEMNRTEGDDGERVHPLWETYLSAFPEGSNPIYRERTEHDCNCCKNFIRTIGNVVALKDGKYVTIWDISIPTEPEYQIVANAMAAKVRSAPINGVFYHYESTVGRAKTFEQLTGKDVHTWNHFAVTLPREVVLRKDTIATVKGQKRSDYDVLNRSLKELDLESVDIVLELIAQNSIYRGAEHKGAVEEFRKLKKAYDKSTEKENFAWSASQNTFGSVNRFRNTSIGTLVSDLASGVDLEVAVKMFESKVAGPNYKRPTSLVTQKMVEDAKKKVAELGLTSALERRYANLTDISINNVLFANRATRKAIEGDAFSDIATKKTSTKSFDKVEEVSIDKFLADILPKAETIELLVENHHQANLMSLIAPADPTAGQLFKWDNGFSWAYNGDMADAIKERVKAAGGNVTGDFCCRLAWYNHDDLDFHMIEHGSKNKATNRTSSSYEIYFGNRRTLSPNGGTLDVDMNAGGGHTRTPVENIVYENISKMKPGKYTLSVTNYSKRDSSDQGFDVQIEILGTKYQVHYDKNHSSGVNKVIAEFEKTESGELKLITELNGVAVSKEFWGIKSQDFVNVNSIMLSPNYWDGQVGIGNKHFFFMLDGCVNDGKARGFFNEYLKADLDKHRKVMEIVGSKMTTAETPNQLSGLGFSSTSKASVVCRVGGSFSRVIKIVF